MSCIIQSYFSLISFRFSLTFVYLITEYTRLLAHWLYFFSTVSRSRIEDYVISTTVWCFSDSLITDTWTRFFIQRDKSECLNKAARKFFCIYRCRCNLRLSLILDHTHSEYTLKLSRWRFAWHVNSYSLSRLIHTQLERLLDALECSTFYDSNCWVDWDDFNDLEIMKKDAGLTLQMSEEILMTLTAWLLNIHHLFSLELILTCWLLHIL